MNYLVVSSIQMGANIDYLENYFVSDSLPGIDGRSISGKAEPISYEMLMAIDTLPDEFKAMRLSFVADGKTLKTVTFNYGDSFGGDVYPEIPEKDGYYAKWDRTELDGLRFDTVVTADYELEYSALPSDERREIRARCSSLKENMVTMMCCQAPWRRRQNLPRSIASLQLP